MTRIALTGASGLLGSALTHSSLFSRDDVVRVVRGEGFAAIETADVVVHLAGAPVGERWTPRTKENIERSRVEGTAALAGAISAMKRKPRVLVSASAVGYYGCDHGDEVLDETSPAGTDFLARVCVGWETAAADAGVRTVHPRFGVVLARQGGALAKMVTPFLLGAGGRIGDGRQWMSWITIDDAVAVIRRAIDDETLHGPVNAVAPGAVTNADFTRALGKALHRPTIAALPAFAVKLAFGEMGETMLLRGQRVAPRLLERIGFEFACPELDGALTHVLAR